MSYRVFIRRISPAVWGMAALSCYILVDTFFVALALGASGLAALNLSIGVFSIVTGLGQMIGMGGGTDFTLRRGEGKNPNAAFYAALCFGIAVSLTLACVGAFFSHSLSLILGADEATLTMTEIYIRVTLLFAPLHILNAILQAFVRNDGAPKLAMFSMMTSSCANIVLDYLFMFPLGMGIFGAVLATGLSAGLSIAVLCLHRLSPGCTLRIEHSHFSLHELLRLLSYGLSALIGELSSALSLFTFNLILMRISGYIAVAAYGVIANAALVASSVFTGVGQGVQPLASHAFGSQNATELIRIRHFTQRTALVLGVFIFALAVFFAVPITQVFNHEGSSDLLSIAVIGLRLYFAGYLFAGTNITAAALLSAISQPSKALVISLLRSCMLLIPSALALSTLLGVLGVWLSFVITEAAVCILALFFLYAEKTALK